MTNKKILTKEELNELKQQYESLSIKLKELNEDELKQVTGGVYIRGLEVIAPYASDYNDWKSDNDVPTEPGNYKIN